MRNKYAYCVSLSKIPEMFVSCNNIFFKGMITISKYLNYIKLANKSNLGLGYCDHINGMLTLAVIILSGSTVDVFVFMLCLSVS
jgi:hypothetical protein